MDIYTVGLYDNMVIHNIRKGVVYKKKGGVAFKSKVKAKSWLDLHLNGALIFLLKDGSENSLNTTKTLGVFTLKEDLLMVNIIY